MRYALINSEGLVVGLIVWDGQTEYMPDEGLSVVLAQDDWNIGGSWDGMTYTPPS